MKCFAIAIMLALLPVSGHAQMLPPNWQTAPATLLDPDTHAPFDLTDNERAAIVKCLTLMNRPTEDHFYYATLDHIARYEPLIIGDMQFINGPLMEAQRYGLSDDEIGTIKPLLRRLRKAVSEAVKTR